MKECNQCGKCCIKYGDGGLSASDSDIEGWELFNPDIYRYVRNGQIWMDPDSGEQLTRCPWLREVADENTQSDSAQLKYTCDIYLDRPEDCRHYPTSIAEMVSDDCEMIEVKDLRNTEQSQNILDKMMADSRPPYGRG